MMPEFIVCAKRGLCIRFGTRCCDVCGAHAVSFLPPVCERQMGARSVNDRLSTIFKDVGEHQTSAQARRRQSYTTRPREVHPALHLSAAALPALRQGADGL